MKPDLLRWLVCPEDQAGLNLCEVQRGIGDEIEEGTLTCQQCGRGYPIRAGIPRFILQELPIAMDRTRRTFGYEWQTFSDRYDFLERQFVEWIRPLEPSAFQGKMVLDAGCGSGMYTQFLNHFGAKGVIALDLSEAIDVARSLNKFPSCHFVQGDILSPPFRHGSFDLVFSKGVVHHLPKPGEGVRSLVKLLNERGSLFLWVYSQEGNGWVVRIVTPIRHYITSRLPLSVERSLSFVIAGVLYLIVKGIYLPAAQSRRPWLKRLLPYAPYLMDHTQYSFRYMHFNVFDHLTAPVAHYIPRTEIEQWFQEHQFKRVEITSRLGMSWSALGTYAD